MTRDVRCEHFRVAGRFDGARTATVTVEYHDSGRAFLRVRPLRRRRAFEALLSDVAAWVIYEETKRRLAERRRERAERRRARKGGR